MEVENQDNHNVYIPDEEEQREINEILNREDEIASKKPKNRIFHDFNSDDHFRGWLKTNGMRW